VSGSRIRRPILVIGYGEAGLIWLQRTSQSYCATTVLEGMVRDRVIQFWALGVADEPEARDPVLRMSSAPSPLEVRQRLDAARTVRVRALYNLDLFQPILVLDRWSLFGQGWEARVALRQSFSTARHVDCDPTKHQDLDYRWITLADAVRPAQRPDSRTIQRIKENYEPETIHDIPFLIDRETAEGSVVDAALADRCYYDFATALVTSDLGFPRHGIGDQVSSAFSTDTDSGCVHPVSVVVLRHPETHILDVLARELQRELLQGERPLPLRQRAQAVPPLARVLDSEIEGRASGQLTLARAREQRATAIAEILAAALILRDAEAALEDLSRTRRRARERTWSPPSAGSRGGSASLGAAAIQIDPNIIVQVGPLVVLAAALLGGLYFWHRRRNPADVIEADDSAAVGDETMEARARWDDLLRRLETALRSWEELLRSSDASEAAAEVWRRALDHPYEWVLDAHADLMEHEFALDDKAYELLAQRLLIRPVEGSDSDDALHDVLRTFALGLIQKRPEIRRSILAHAFSSANVGSLRAGIHQLPLLVNTGRIVKVMEVLWLSDLDQKLSDALLALEPATQRPLARVLGSDDRSRTMRIAIGEPVAWTAVMSLEFLGV
jgi:hypothetical protein